MWGNHQGGATMTELTEKENRFCEAYILNKGDKVKSYTQAGYSTSMSKAAIAVQADKVFNKPKIHLKIKQLQKIDLTVMVASKEDKLLILEKVIKACSLVDDEKGMVNAPSVIAAIKEHNLMQGDNAPTQIDNTHTITKVNDANW